ncbi:MULTISPECIES: hypothetical protein [unclassified Lysinibacillus]|uniref:hypothetical protein n=1 Tax=unclassified Lysinibacillus TaxID=2636778 RepID=UPI003822B53F
MAKKEKRKVTQSVADAMQELEKWMGADKERSEKVLIVAELIAYGFEVAPTPEEIILKNYKNAERIVDTEEDDRDAPLINKGYMTGVEETLNALKIKIKWVNE